MLLLKSQTPGSTTLATTRHSLVIILTDQKVIYFNAFIHLFNFRLPERKKNKLLKAPTGQVNDIHVCIHKCTPRTKQGQSGPHSEYCNHSGVGWIFRVQSNTIQTGPVASEALTLSLSSLPLPLPCKKNKNNNNPGWNVIKTIKGGFLCLWHPSTVDTRWEPRALYNRE